MRHQPKLGIKSFAGALWRIGLPRHLANEKPGKLAIRLEISARDEPLIHDERQHIIAVHASIGGRVDLDSVAEAEEAFSAAALPYERIERGEQRLAGDTTRPLRVTMKKGRHSPT